MTDPARRRPDHDDLDHDHVDEDDERVMSVSESERRLTDPGKETYYAYDDPEAAIRGSDPARTDGSSLFEIDDGVETSDAAQEQPPPPGVGPFPRHLVYLIVALVIFVVLLAALA